MILKDTLRRIINDQRNEVILLKNSIERDILNEVPINLPYAIIISGFIYP